MQPNKHFELFGDANEEEDIALFCMNSTQIRLQIISEVDGDDICDETGETVCKRRVGMRNRAYEEQQLINDYCIAIFDEDKVLYLDEKKLRPRYRMRRSLLLRIIADLELQDDYFKYKPDTTGSLELLVYSVWRKATAGNETIGLRYHFKYFRREYQS